MFPKDKRKPIGECAADRCTYHGELLLKKYCRTHYAFFNRHGIPTHQPRTPALLEISEGWKMWLAGVIDCEGWIGFSSYDSHGVKAYYPGVGVGNTNRKLIDQIIDITGIGKCAHTARKAPAKDIYTWLISKRNDVDDILFTIRPYLILKGEQADILLSLPPLNSRARDKRIIAKARIAALNKRGK